MSNIHKWKQVHFKRSNKHSHIHSNTRRRTHNIRVIVTQRNQANNGNKLQSICFFCLSSKLVSLSRERLWRRFEYNLKVIQKYLYRVTFSIHKLHTFHKLQTHIHACYTTKESHFFRETQRENSVSRFTKSWPFNRYYGKIVVKMNKGDDNSNTNTQKTLSHTQRMCNTFHTN